MNYELSTINLLFRQILCPLNQRLFFVRNGFYDEVVRQRMTLRIDVDEGDKAADHHFPFHFGLDKGDHARSPDADDATLEADDLAEVHRAAEEHAVDLQTHDVFRFCQRR